MKRNIYIIEDHSIFANNIEDIILKYLKNTKNNHKPCYFSDPIIISKDFKPWSEAYSNKEQVQHLFILDVSLDDQISGFQLAKAIREKDVSSQFIFLTSHGEMMNEVFINNLKALSFINKQDALMEERLYSALDQIFHEIDLKSKSSALQVSLKSNTTEETYLKYQYKNTHYRIKHHDIIAIETDTFKRRLWIKTTHGNFFCQLKMEQILEVLPSFFARIHRSVVVNLNTVQRLYVHEGQHRVVLKDKSELPVSKTYHTFLKDYLKK